MLSLRQQERRFIVLHLLLVFLLQPGEPSLEIVEKEKVHRENCLILCLVPRISDLESKQL